MFAACMCVCYVYGLKHVIPLICVFKQTKITSEKEWFFGKIIKKFQFMCEHTDTWHTHNVHPSSFKQIQANWNYHIKQIYWIILLVHTQIHTREHIKRERARPEAWKHYDFWVRCCTIHTEFRVLTHGICFAFLVLSSSFFVLRDEVFCCCFCLLAQRSEPGSTNTHPTWWIFVCVCTAVFMPAVLLEREFIK